MESYFEVNVGYRGEHLFATAPRSARTGAAALKLAREFQYRFPKDAGYSVTISRWEGRGREYDNINAFSMLVENGLL